MQTVDGCAYLLVGVEPQNLCGVTPIDAADLEQGVATYVGGAEGPAWNPSYEEVDGVTVLVITVEPPRWGDPVFTFRRGFDAYRDGDIFIRRAGKTDRATSAEIKMLLERASRAQEGRLALELGFRRGDEPLIEAIDLNSEAVAEWRKEEGNRLTREYNALGGRLGDRSTRILLNPTLPSPERFDSQLASYLAQSEDEIASRSYIAAIEAELGIIRFAVSNPTDENFADVVVIVSLPAGFSAFEDEYDLPSESELTPAPRVRTDYSSILGVPRIQAVTPVNRPRAYVQNGPDGAEVEFSPIHVRPRQTHNLPPVHVFADSRYAGQTVDLAWRATATSERGLFEDSIRVNVSSTKHTPWAIKLLRDAAEESFYD